MKYPRMLALAMIFIVSAGTVFTQENYQEVQLNYNEGMKNFKQKNYAMAIEHFKALTELRPNYDYAYFMIGLSYMVQKKFDEALKNFNLAVENGKNDFDVWSNIANIHFYKKNYAQAAKELSKLDPAKLDDPSKQKYYALRGKLFYVNKDFASAIPDLQKSVAMAKDPGVYLMLGTSQYYEGDYKGAISSLKNAGDSETALELSVKSNIDLAKQTDSASEKSNYYNAAVSSAQKLIAKKPGDFEANSLHAQALLGAKKYTEAVSSFNKALGLKAGDCLTVFNLGMAYQGSGNWNSALENYLKATKCMSADNTVWYFTGWAYENLGQLENAKAAYEKSDSLKRGSRSADIGRITAKIENKNIDKETAEIESQNKAAEDQRKRIFAAIKFSAEDMKIEGGFVHIFGRVHNNSEASPVEISVKLEVFDSANKILSTKRLKQTVNKGDSKSVEQSLKESSLTGKVASFKFSVEDIAY